MANPGERLMRDRNDRGDLIPATIIPEGLPEVPRSAKHSHCSMRRSGKPIIAIRALLHPPGRMSMQAYRWEWMLT